MRSANVLKDIPTNQLLFEMKLRGYICYEPRWERTLRRCPKCGHKIGQFSVKMGVWSIICGKCGKRVSGKSLEEATREWNLMTYTYGEREEDFE